MKVIWLTNVATQMVDSIINENKRSFFGGGWLDGLSERLLSDKSFKLVLCYPLYTQKENIEGGKDNFKFYGCELYKNYSEKNMGTCMRQYTGFSWVFEKEEQAIILEDDCIPNLDFFRYCDEMLEKYKDDERVMMVSGSNYLKKWESGYSYHFSSMGGIWGWATWRRAWLKYDVDIRAWGDYELKKELREKLGWEMYQHRREAWDSLYMNSSKAKTWDFQWWFARTINSGLTIIPSVNLVSNVGFDSGAVHTTASSPNVNLEVYDLKFPLKHPNYVMENTGYDRALFNSLFRGRFRKRLHRKVNDLLEWKGKV